MKKSPPPSPAANIDNGDADDGDPVAAARAAKLRYTNDTDPGIRRVRTRTGFRFTDPKGRLIRDPEIVARIRKLAIPPAYRDVWVCPQADGHLQATGRDARGRKQYRYHPTWRLVRDSIKYEHMLAFGRALPGIRARVAHDLALPGLPREKVLAAIVRLLETTLERIGNDEYARANRSFGLTTLRSRHVRVNGATAIFDFRGKHNIQRHLDVTDRRLAKIVASCRDLPGQALFQYIDGEGRRHGVGSDDVNDYLRSVSGTAITAKDFRTWAATNLAALALQAFEAFDTKAKAKKNVVQAVESVARRLGNTPAICRKCYIHPAIFDGYLDGSLAEGLKTHADAVLALSADQARAEGLTAEEAAVTAFLSRRLDVATG